MIKPTPLERKEWRVSEEDMRGLSLRLFILGSHYRKEVDFTVRNLNENSKILRRWLSKAIPNNDRPPLEIILALSDDLNTPLAIAEMHRYAKKDGRSLFSAMRFLGLIPGEEKPIDYDIVSEVKTIPIDHIPLTQWEYLEVN